MSKKPVAAGKSSYDLIDTEKTFEMMGVKPGSSFLDLGCGAGKYSIRIAKEIGPEGTVYAVDLWKEGIDSLRKEADETGMRNIRTIVADISKRLPLEDGSIDSCLMATILHDLSKKARNSTVNEIRRLLAPGGMLNVLEFKKIDKGPGPPVDIRMEESEVDRVVTQHGFLKVAGGDAGEFNYLLKYRKIA